MQGTIGRRISLRVRSKSRRYVLRYETKVERQRYRAMAQLERVPRMRSGEAIPVPLSVEVSDRG